MSIYNHDYHFCNHIVVKCVNWDYVLCKKQLLIDAIVLYYRFVKNSILVFYGLWYRTWWNFKFLRRKINFFASGHAIYHLNYEIIYFTNKYKEGIIYLNTTR